MAEPDDGATAGMPRWVKVFLIGAVGLALLVAVVLLVSGGDHGPGRHMQSGVAPFGVGRR